VAQKEEQGSGEQAQDEAESPEKKLGHALCHGKILGIGNAIPFPAVGGKIGALEKKFLFPKSRWNGPMDIACIVAVDFGTDDGVAKGDELVVNFRPTDHPKLPIPVGNL
jgi:hypothetical protein